jgi:hypothetical protein
MRTEPCEVCRESEAVKKRACGCGRLFFEDKNFGVADEGGTARNGVESEP